VLQEIKIPEKKKEKYSRPSKNTNQMRDTSTSNINKMVVYNIKLDSPETKSDKTLSPTPQQKKLIENPHNFYNVIHKQDNKLIQSTLEQDENLHEALKFMKTIPNVELFDRPKRTIPKRS